ncbi:MAG: hypothetical protein S4CHLAM123_12290 [Chlamydiales bacterium]|nr:hypothetical protein [Chlamydiales bacterium]
MFRNFFCAKRKKSLGIVVKLEVWNDVRLYVDGFIKTQGNQANL